MRRRLLVLGASGHGKVVADCARAAGGWVEIVFFDGRFPELATCQSWQVAGGNEDFFAAAAAGDPAFVAIGNADARLSWIDRLTLAGAHLATIVHPSAVVSPEAKIGHGSVIAPGAIVNIAVEAGAGVIVNTGASVDHDCRLGDGVHVCPGGRLAGDVTVGRASWIGIGAVVRQGIRIGAGVTVGAGAAVVSDIEDGATVAGVPARVLMRPDQQG